jgi:hypothetical protein
MPRIPAGVAIRSDLNGSPGWVIGQYRILFVSAPYGKTKKVKSSASTADSVTATCHPTMYRL